MDMEYLHRNEQAKLLDKRNHLEHLQHLEMNKQKI